MMKRIKSLSILLGTALFGLVSACSDLTPIDYSEINPNNFHYEIGRASCRERV